jgi:hypothetical protein
VELVEPQELVVEELVVEVAVLQQELLTLAVAVVVDQTLEDLVLKMEQMVVKV